MTPERNPQRVVAELGRPETPDETAARKAESSRVYRSSQTFRNLIAAIIVTVVVVFIVIFGVPRGELPERESIDPAPIAEQASESLGRSVIVPAVPSDWRVNIAELSSDGGSSDGGSSSWSIAYVPDDEGFIRFAQAFDTDELWARSALAGTAPTETLQIEGVEWDVFEPADPSRAANISYALGTQAGADYVLLYGAVSPEQAAELATIVASDVKELQGASR
ncbi:Amino acid transporters [Microbacterium sp. C448]|uniref:DUF4245 family protein n=1 Tax=Microbacterium sp. C448 TaxID=1177594 RepID=UPI0003DE6F06|nr:DUF4245 family protein [Microbacterium sp. C448]CDJ99178.1 Amino acid transporters [Microbacterium sp. C448]